MNFRLLRFRGETDSTVQHNAAQHLGQSTEKKFSDFVTQIVAANVKRYPTQNNPQYNWDITRQPKLFPVFVVNNLIQKNVVFIVFFL